MARQISKNELKAILQSAGMNNVVLEDSDFIGLVIVCKSADNIRETWDILREELDASGYEINRKADHLKDSQVVFAGYSAYAGMWVLQVCVKTSAPSHEDPAEANSFENASGYDGAVERSFKSPNKLMWVSNGAYLVLIDGRQWRLWKRDGENMWAFYQVGKREAVEQFNTWTEVRDILAV